MSTSLFDLNGKVALVTGAAQGMGRAMALALAEAGADLMIVDRNEDGATKTAALVGAYGRRGRGRNLRCIGPGADPQLVQRSWTLNLAASTSSATWRATACWEARKRSRLRMSNSRGETW